MTTRNRFPLLFMQVRLYLVKLYRLRA
jgi:hypothetical protein